MIFNEELNNINNFVSYVKACKEAMRQALIGQEQDIPVEATLDTYADYIAAIEGGGGVTVYTVQYLDWNGAVLKSQQVLPDGIVLPPANPSRDEWVFKGWSGTSTNVQSDLVITAQYEYAQNIVTLLDYDLTLIQKSNISTGGDVVVDNPNRERLSFTGWSDSLTNIQSSKVALANYKANPESSCYLYITLDATTGLSPTFYFFEWLIANIVFTHTYSINWGDGNTTNASVSRNTAFNVNHTYAANGSYIIEITTDGVITLGNIVSGGNSLLLGNYRKALRKVYLGKSDTTSSTLGCVVLWGHSLIGCVNLTDVVYSNLSSVSSNTFINCSSLERIIFPSSLTSMGKGADVGDVNGIYGCTNLRTIIFLNNNPPTLNNGTLLGVIPYDCKIYVPDDSVAAYKSLFTDFTNVIYPLGQLASNY